MGEISFIGEPPYDLTLAKSTEAKAVDTTVEVTLFVDVPNKRIAPCPIRIAMTVPVARELILQIQSALSFAQKSAYERRQS